MDEKALEAGARAVLHRREALSATIQKAADYIEAAAIRTQGGVTDG